jgi:hypothetical protein
METRLMKRFALAMVLVAACKSKAKPPADAAPVVVADAAAAAVAVAAVDAAGAAVAPAAAPPPMPSVAMAAQVPEGPMLAAGGARVVWCTRGDNGMAEWVEVICHVASPGKKTTVIPVMTFADAMIVDEGADPAVDPDAGVRAASARDRIEAGLAKLASEGGAELAPMPAVFACAFQSGELVRREDDPLGAYDGCSAHGVTANISAPGKVTLTSHDQPLFAEVFKPRARGKGAAGAACYLEASAVEISVDETKQVAALAVRMSNPSDACALVTEYEVRAVKLP